MTECNLLDGDVLSELPTWVIHHIMSFLAYKDVVRMRTLSKTLRDVFASYPCLVFDEYSCSEKNVLLREVVNVTLQKFMEQSLWITSFKLTMTFKDDVAYEFAYLEEWIELLIMKFNVKKIILWTNVLTTPRWRLPGILFTYNSLIKLKSNCCDLKYSDSMILGQCSLRVLDLSLVTIDEEAINNLKYYCPLLESISIKDCSGFTRLNIDGLNRLKSLEYEWYHDNETCPTIKLEAPSLEVLDLSCHNSCDCRFFTTSNSGFNSLKKLLLRWLSWESERVQNIMSRCCCSLEHLSLLWCVIPREMQISSPSLKTVIIEEPNDSCKVEFDTPKLSAFTFRATGEEIRELFVAHTSSSSRRDWSAELKLSVVETINNTWFQRLVAFVSTNQFQALALTMYRECVSMDECWVSPTQGPYKLDKLQIEQSFVYEDYIAALLNGLLWYFRPMHLSFKIDKWPRRPASLKILEHELKKEIELSCCESSDLKCWRHFLYGVEKIDEDPYGFVSFKLLWS